MTYKLIIKPQAELDLLESAQGYEIKKQDLEEQPFRYHIPSYVFLGAFGRSVFFFFSSLFDAFTFLFSLSFLMNSLISFLSLSESGGL